MKRVREAGRAFKSDSSSSRTHLHLSVLHGLDDKEQAECQYHANRKGYEPGLDKAGDDICQEGYPRAGKRVGQLGGNMVHMIALGAR